MVTQAWSAYLGDALGVSAMVYAAAACLAVSVRDGSRAACVPCSHSGSRPVTLLKPLCGAEVETYACLRTFCIQDYPAMQIVFGVCDPADPVIAIVQRLRSEFPTLDLHLVVDRRQHGSSRKVSNLINMMSAVRHDILVLSDSDVQVAADYLSRLIEPLADVKVGIVTCAYRGVPRSGLWSILGAMYINEWFMPSVRVAALAGSREFAFGATIAMRRSVLARIGGFHAVADQLADDYRLGEMTRRLGLRTVLSDVEVDTFVVERSFCELARHELRWLRTIRAVRPTGFAFSFVTFSLPVAIAAVAVSGGTELTSLLLGLTVAARGFLHRVTPQCAGGLVGWLALPARDMLTLCFWVWSFSARSVQWRDDRYVIARDGSALPVARI